MLEKLSLAAEGLLRRSGYLVTEMVKVVTVSGDAAAQSWAAGLELPTTASFYVDESSLGCKVRVQ